ncbi:MAG TPA: ABC transporter permease [Planctomycetaceae bacterium]|nr:ABC transporter permease [Planctomycetaceae bacterium]
MKRHEFGLIVAILAVIVLTGLLDAQHNYWNRPWDSTIDILRHGSLLGIFALGAAIVIIIGGIDLSSGSVIAFAGTICGVIMVALAPEQMQSGKPLGIGVLTVAILGTLLVGFLIGSLHAWLITVIGLPPFVATLATLVGLRSLARVIIDSATRSSKINVYDESFLYLAQNVWIPTAIFVVLAALTWVFLSRTVVGRHLYALGGNEQAAKLSGIRTDRLKWLAYCLSAMLSSLAGILYFANVSSIDPQTLGRGYELNGIAAAVVGGCSLQGGVGTVPGTVLGTLFLRIVVDGIAKVIKVGADVYEGMIVGIVVVLAVAFTQSRQMRRQAKPFFSGALGAVTIVNLTLLAGTLAIILGPQLMPGKSVSRVLLGGVAAALVAVVLLAMRFFETRRLR